MNDSEPSQSEELGITKLKHLLLHDGFRVDEHMKLWVKPEFLLPNPDQPRKNFDETSLLRHQGSIVASGQIEPVVIIPYLTESGGAYIGKIVDGERTWRACSALNQWVYVVFTDPPKNNNELFERALIANFDQQKHTINETINAVARLHDQHGRSFEEIQAQLALGSRSDVYNYYRLRQLHPDLRPLLDVSAADVREKGLSRMAKIVGLKLSEFPKEQQQNLWSEVMALGAVQAARKLDAHKLGASVGTPHDSSQKKTRQTEGDAWYAGSNKSPSDLLNQLAALTNRANADMHYLCVSIPPDKLSAIVQKMCEAGTLTGMLSQIENIYLTSAYLYLTLASMQVEQTRGSKKADQIREQIRARLNLGNWEPQSVTKAREAKG